jgi:predicted phosphoribosyltransferase
MMQIFKNRKEAGKILAEKLREYAGRSDVLVLGLPRGGVPVAYEVARALNAPLDVLIVRKLGVPGQEELGFGAIAADGEIVLNENLVRALHITPEMVRRIVDRETEELNRRDVLYRGGRPFPRVEDKLVIVVDDGLATGSTMRAAIEMLRTKRAGQIIVAVPVGSRDTCEKLDGADALCICATTPEPLYGVGMWYEDFSQTQDDEVRRLLYEAGTFSDRGKRSVAAK